MEKIDDLLALIPEGWDFWIGVDWGRYEVRLLKRADDHQGHHYGEVEVFGASMRAALTEAIKAANTTKD